MPKPDFNPEKIPNGTVEEAIEKNEKKTEIKPEKKQTKEKTRKTEIKETEPILEPVLNDYNPKWLKITEKTDLPNREEIQMIIKGEKTPWLNKLEFELIEQNLWQCKKCYSIIQNNEKPETCTACNRVTGFNKITDEINMNRWKLPIWKNIPKEDINMLLVYDDLKKILKKCIVLGEDIYYDLLALWIIASYKNECFDSISFLLFLGLIESGKTRGLDLIRELGYRMIHTTGVTFPCMCRYTHNHKAGILIDEIDNKIDRKTEDGRKYLDFLKPSYRKGSVYAVAHKDDQTKTMEYNNYGFKAFAGERGGNDNAFLSRCIIFTMEQDYPEVPSLKYVKDELDDLQTVLLNYRYKFNNPDELPVDFDLRGRDREIFGCLIRIASHIGLEYGYILDFIHKRKKEIVEELQESDDYQILKAIYESENLHTLDDAPEELSYGRISELCGWDDDDNKKKRQRIGYILHKKFHLKTKRRSEGMFLLLNNEKNKRRLANYFKRYGLLS